MVTLLNSLSAFPLQTSDSNNKVHQFKNSVCPCVVNHWHLWPKMGMGCLLHTRWGTFPLVLKFVQAFILELWSRTGQTGIRMDGQLHHIIWPF